MQTVDMCRIRVPLLILFVRSLGLDRLGRWDASDSGHGDFDVVVVSGLLQVSRTEFPALLETVIQQIASCVACTNSRTSLERDVCKRRQDTDTVQLRASKQASGEALVGWAVIAR